MTAQRSDWATDQAWYWTPEWQAGEAEADADIAAGRVTRYRTDAEFLDALDEPHGRLLGLPDETDETRREGR